MLTALMAQGKADGVCSLRTHRGAVSGFIPRIAAAALSSVSEMKACQATVFFSNYLNTSSSLNTEFQLARCLRVCPVARGLKSELH